MTGFSHSQKPYSDEQSLGAITTVTHISSYSVCPLCIVRDNKQHIAAKSKDKFHMNNNTWEVIPRPRKRMILRSRRVFVVKLLFTIAALPDFAIRQMDVMIAFRNCFLIYITLVEGFTVPGNEDLVCKTPIEPLRVNINSPLPGIKRFLDFTSSKQTVVCFYKLRTVSPALYVDDLLIFASTPALVKSLFGWSIQHDRKNRTLFVHQHKYATKVINRFSDYIPYPIATPADQNFILSVSSLPTTEAEKDAINVLSYREAVDSIMYIMATYPPWQCIKHQAREPSRQRDSVQFCRRICDYAIKQSDRMASVQTPPDCLSTPEAEYIALFHCMQKPIFVKVFLRALGFAITNANHIYDDNQSCIKKCYNPEKVERHEFSITYCNTKDMISDTFTKAQDKHPFRDLRTMIFPAR
ncbi:LOW QUALITY PROTEIN: Integrase, catalytic core protein [Phytophthora megakarya]|uniref:Integrase, catalytic core protein n=1 Tax=Phytophthora megakarya TaxID=4795 RepID=A0A225VS40_9STRA|nr:LOW QUALITY PROTEIN: Integrase, catalytic core protein [Phytophthora megakarya]